MGGNALKQGSVRLKRADYIWVESAVRRVLQNTKGVGWCEVPAYFHEKDSFGDLDVVWYARYSPEQPASPFTDQFLRENFGATEVVRNGKVVSFDFHNPSLGLENVEGGGFQVDLIEVPYEDAHFAHCYYSWNDLGNLIGVIAKAKGFKLGHQGFFYRYTHDRTCNTKDILLTKNWYEALNFLGFEGARWREGFETLEELFEYVASSDYFDPKLYSLEALNCVNRVRNRKRGVYMAFLKWLEEKYPEPRLALVKHEDLQLKAFEEFPKLETDLTHVVQDIVFREKVKEVFNGKLVSSWTGAEGKDLGRIMKSLRDSFPNEISFQLAALYDWQTLYLLARDFAGLSQHDPE